MEKRSYDSKTYYDYYNKRHVYQLPNLYGYVQDTQVCFVNEKVCMTLHNTGAISFQDEAGNVLAEITVTPDTKNGKHEDAFCKGSGEKIMVWLPIVEYVDNYPHCDGEHDRWDSRCIAYDLVVFDISGRTVERSVVKELGKEI